jgi:Mrp family chromosome partitioning ATPase
MEKGQGNYIDKTILVMSGKGGVGKSMAAVNLAVWLAMQGSQTGLLDIDLHGPSVPKLLGMEEQKVFQIEGQMHPVLYRPNLKVMSIGFLLDDPNTPIIWRGPAKHSFLQQCIQNVWWDRLDFLIVDCPPGTGDEVLSVVQLLGKIDGAVVISTPQEVAVLDVRKCLSFCRQMDILVLGIIENMNGLVCPHCGKKWNFLDMVPVRRPQKNFMFLFSAVFLSTLSWPAPVISAVPLFKTAPCILPRRPWRPAFRPLLQRFSPYPLNQKGVCR